MDTMTIYTKDQIWKNFAALPETVRDLMFSPEAGDAIYSIAKRNNIGDKARELHFCTDLILSGVAPITSFRNLIENELQLDQEHARIIAMEIRDKILMQVKDDLRQIHGLDKS